MTTNGKFFAVCDVDAVDALTLNNSGELVASLPEVTSCGVFSACVNGFCSCNPGWSRSLEFDLYEPDLTRRGLNCDSHSLFLQILYGFMALFGSFIIGLTFYYAEKWKDIKRVIVSTFGVAVLAVYGIVRAVQIEKHLLTVDRFATIVYIIALYSFLIEGLLFINKYIQFQKKKLPRRKGMSRGVGSQGLKYSKSVNGLSKSHIKFWMVMQYVILLVGTAGALCFGLIPFVSPEAQSVLIRVNFCIQLINMAHSSIALHVLLNALINDMEEILERHNPQLKQSGNGRRNQGPREYTNKASKLIIMNQIGAALPGMKKFKYSFLTSMPFFWLLVLPAVFSDPWLRAWKFFIPIMITSFLSYPLMLLRWIYFSEKLVEAKKKRTLKADASKAQLALSTEESGGYGKLSV